MLLSMTGFGEARRQKACVAVGAEVRTVNSRFFKLSVRSSEGYNALEPRVEQAVRGRIRRGTVQVNLRIDRPPRADDFRINEQVLGHYRRQLGALEREWGAAETVTLAVLLSLPGVVQEQPPDAIPLEHDWPIIEEALAAAIDSLEQMRRDEGRAMAADLAANCRQVAESLAKIEARASLVAQDYAARLTERLQRSLAELDVVLDPAAVVLDPAAVVLDPAAVVREVALFAERADISEEIIRLRSHQEQFEAILAGPESAGRKLEFVSQEMLREANTIGSKANDVEIAQQVIEIKSAVERIREMLQNVE